MVFAINTAMEYSTRASELNTEIIRKSIHLLIALVPGIAAINRTAAIFILMIGIFGYSLMEYLRFYGVKIPVISSLTRMASRPHDIGQFVMGPVTLGLGALLALVLFPPVAAAIAVYALAFGDSASALAGKFFGKRRPAFLFGKSIEGSLACFATVFLPAYIVSGRADIALVAAFTATAAEALPLGDYDNLAIPVTVGLAVFFASAAL
jgi:dolichol kinase